MNMTPPHVDAVTSQFCWTAAGCLIHEHKVLLVKHAKLGNWLNPGGHLDPHEQPHHGAEREFFEETGLKVVAYSGATPKLPSTDQSKYLPNPISTNLHWISPENYYARVEQRDTTDQSFGKRGCEQHLNFLYLVRLADETSLKDQTAHPTEVTEMEWFTKDELASIDMFHNVRLETELAFDIVSSQFS